MGDSTLAKVKSPPGYLRGVKTLDDRELSAVCQELYAAVRADFQPGVLIGIGTGGFRVAEELARLSDGDWPVLALGLHRPTTGVKLRYRRAGRLLARLPVSSRDQLRLLEHRVLTRSRPPAAAPVPTLTDPRDLEVLRSWCDGAGPTPRILVVDDAVDTGSTLAYALDLVAGAAPAGAIIRTAVITVTTAHPIAAPDFVVLRGWLCRFPWSMDA